LIEQLDESSRDIRKRISAITEILVLLIWEIDPKRYAEFSQLTPSVSRFAAGEFQVTKRMGPARPVTAKDARFCFKFALDAALVIQRQRREVPDIYGAQELKTKAKTVFYTLDEKQVPVAWGQIPEGEVLDGFCEPGHSLGGCWGVTWRGSAGVVKADEVVELDND